MYNRLMKLVIQIPCYNEGECILEVLKNLPKKLLGIDKIEVVVLDDGSDDDTSKIALNYGVDKVIKSQINRGLSYNFMTGVNYALEIGADVLVNIDGDNQYCASDIQKLINPILENSCDIVIGARDIKNIKAFSSFKKAMQKFGSLMVKLISGIDVKDAASGFRAFSKDALLNLNVFNQFSYTIETIVQAKNKNLKVTNVDINVNEQINRKSKLFKNDFDYIFKQAKNLIRFFIIYRPARFFMINAFIFFFLGLLISFRYLWFFFNFDGSGHVQSLILASIIFILSFLCFILAIIGDLFSINRKLLEDIQYKLRCDKYKK